MKVKELIAGKTYLLRTDTTIERVVFVNMLLSQKHTKIYQFLENSTNASTHYSLWLSEDNLERIKVTTPLWNILYET